jgi:GNAT superfamily N-acetyltransferase
MMAVVTEVISVRGLQERAARALPAQRVAVVDGWWLRHAPGCAWWVGTVLPHGDASAGDLLRRVVEAERFHAGHGTAASFQISPGACPEELDAVLAVRGYRRDSSVSLRVVSCARVLERAPVGASRVGLDERLTRTWFEVWWAVHGGDFRSEWDLLGRVDRPSAFAYATVGNDVVAVGRAVLDAGWVGVFGMATLPAARGKGAALGVLAEMANWAGMHGAERMYLQVPCDNITALRLYERAGFEEICQYHYRAGSAL